MNPVELVALVLVLVLAAMTMVILSAQRQRDYYRAETEAAHRSRRIAERALREIAREPGEPTSALRAQVALDEIEQTREID